MRFAPKLPPGCLNIPSMLLTKVFLRRITVQELRDAFETGEVIENYPDDKYGPSCLIYGTTIDDRPLHVQCSYPSRPLLKIITLYEPDPERWIEYRARKVKDEN